jgi:hypothetical protein
MEQAGTSCKEMKNIWFGKEGKTAKLLMTFVHCSIRYLLMVASYVHMNLEYEEL